jgi:hypothetical protein
MPRIEIRSHWYLKSEMDLLPVDPNRFALRMVSVRLVDLKLPATRISPNHDIGGDPTEDMAYYCVSLLLRRVFLLAAETVHWLFELAGSASAHARAIPIARSDSREPHSDT